MSQNSGHRGPHRLGVLIGRLVRCSGGTTVPEYALIVAILTAGACIAYVAAGSHTNSILSSTARLTDELSGGQDSWESDANRSDHAESRLAATGHPMKDPSWMARHAAVIMGTIAWIATMTIGLVTLRVFRSVARGLQEGKAVEDLPMAGIEPTSYDRLAEKRQQICRLVARDVEDKGCVHTRVQHLMSKHVTTVGPATPVQEALEMMTCQGIRHLLVCDEHGHLMGIVSDRDVKNRQGETVFEIMTPNPTVAQPDVPIGPAITLMLQHNISCLPVLERGQLCGVLTSTDVMLSCQCMLHVLEANTTGPTATGPTATGPTATASLGPTGLTSPTE